MSLQDTMVVEPGWYPDPAGGERLRWWSGAGWTDHLSAPIGSLAGSEAPEKPGAPEKPHEAEVPDEAEVPEVAEKPEAPQKSGAAEELGAVEKPRVAEKTRAAEVTEVAVASVGSAVPVIAGSRRAARLARESGHDAETLAAARPIARPVVAETSTLTDPELDPDPDPDSDPDPDPAMAIPAVDPWWVPVTAEDESMTSPAAAEWRPVPARTNWNTPESWLLSALLLVGTAVAMGAYLFAASVSVSIIPAPSGLLVLIASIVLAKRDRRALDEKGVGRLPSLWWLLLGPTFYLGARAFAVLRAGGNAWAPFWVALASNVACIVVAFVLGFMSAVSTVPVTPAVEETIEADLAAQGYAWQIECPDPVDVSAGSSFSCEVLEGEASVVTVDISADGELTYSAE